MTSQRNLQIKEYNYINKWLIFVSTVNMDETSQNIRKWTNQSKYKKMDETSQNHIIWPFDWESMPRMLCQTE